MAADGLEQQRKLIQKQKFKKRKGGRVGLMNQIILEVIPAGCVCVCVCVCVRARACVCPQGETGQGQLGILDPGRWQLEGDTNYCTRFKIHRCLIVEI